MKTTTWGVLLLICYSTHSMSQSKPDNVIPPSPTAAALGKYGDIPVSTYTGIPNISIPLYNIQDKSINVPITLSYHASGVKVEEEASWAGLGWSVLAGGTITRSIRGSDDLPTIGGRYGYPDSPFPITPDDNNDYVPAANPLTANYFFRDVSSKMYDAEPDVFYFNFGGHSGKFFIKKRLSTSAPYTFAIESQEKIKIELVPPTANTGWSWIVTTGDGTRYDLKTQEKTLPYSGSSDDTEPSPTNTIPPVVSSQETVVSTWYLDKITAPDGNHVDFLYTAPSVTGSRSAISKSEERVHYTNIVQYMEPSGESGPPPPYHRYFSAMNVSYDVYLKEIDFKNGSIQFSTTNRLDIQPASPTGDIPQKLDKISISEISPIDHSLKEIRSFQFNYDYFTNTDPHMNYGSYNIVNTYSGKRLKLTSLVEKNGNVVKPPYEFSYQQSSYVYGDIPDKYSKSKDHWGYFNNANNRLIYDPDVYGNYVSTIIPPYLDIAASKYYPGADREPNEDFVKLGMLNQIKYPTGGTASFEYESNDYSNFADQNKKETMHIYVAAAGANVDAATNLYPDYVESASIAFSAPTAVTILGSFSYTPEYCNNPVSYGGSGTATITSTGSTPYFTRGVAPSALDCSGGGFESKTIVVPAGTYEIRATADEYAITQASITYEQATTEPLLQKKGGGVRIAKITTYNGLDHANDVIKQFKYTYVDALNRERSSGVLMSPYNYEYIYTTQNYIYGNGYALQSEITNLKRSSETNIVLGNSAQGSPIGYSTVTTLENENGSNGKTVSSYINIPDVANIFPNIPRQHVIANGFLKSQIVYKKNNTNTGNAFQKVSETIKEYTPETSVSQLLKGMKCIGCESVDQALNTGIPYVPAVKFYDNNSEWWYQSSETNTTYDVNEQNPVTVTTNFYYDNPVHLQLTRTVTTKSDGKIVTKVNTYPEDYASGTPFIDAMKTDFIMTKPIEQISYQDDGTNTKVLNGQITQYQSGGLINKVFKLESNSPINATGFKFSNKSSGQLPFPLADPLTTYGADSHYQEKITYYPYDAEGNPLMITPKDGASVSYQWGYNKQYPVAECKNAANDEFFTESFEESALTGVVLGTSHTGNKYFSGSYTTNDKLAPDYHGRSYTISYWFKNASVWTYSGELAYTGQTLTGDIDDIRIYATNAQVTTYTYEPLVGLTSATDPKGQTTYYEYDSFQRLSNVKDQHGNIKTHYCYNYKGQATDCSAGPPPPPPQQIYARLEIGGPIGEQNNTYMHDEYYTTGELFIKFYSDPDCTQPVTTNTAMTITLSEIDSWSNYYDSTSNPYTNDYQVPANVSSFSIGTFLLSDYNTYFDNDENETYDNYTYDYDLLPHLGSNYIVKPLIYY